MDSLTRTFEERLQEIETYLDLLDAFELQVGLGPGPPIIGDSIITPQQQKILYSSVYLQLYNLIEATITWCVSSVCNAAAKDGRWRPGDLSENLRREWVKHEAKTNVVLNKDKRLDNAVAFCENLIQALPVMAWSIEKSGGNWDENQISDIAGRIGFDLSISPAAYKGIKRPIRDDKGPLVLVKDLRNQLAHGKLSFAECGAGVTVIDLRDLKDKTAIYLREVVAAFDTFVAGHEFLILAKRPGTHNNL